MTAPGNDAPATGAARATDRGGSSADGASAAVDRDGLSEDRAAPPGDRGSGADGTAAVADRGGSGAPGGGADRRGLVAAVVLCVAGAGIALFATTRTWAMTPTRRPAPLPPVETPHTGTSYLGWLIAVALVALAGAGALLATRGRARVAIGAVLGVAGLVIFVGGLDGLRYADVGRIAWPVLVMVGGAAAGLAGVRAMRRGRSWPGMGTRYERSAGAKPADRPVTDATMWDDLDRGVDPTDRA